MIRYYSEQVSFRLKDRKKITSWITAVADTYSFKVKSLNFIFSSDEYILDINKRFLCHDFYTDVITFDTSQYDTASRNIPDNIICGDIFISIDTVKSNSHIFDVSFENELYRVMIHGVLHLIGFDDLNDSDFDRMKEQENIALSLLYEK